MSAAPAAPPPQPSRRHVPGTETLDQTKRTLGANARRVRLSRGWTQGQVAAKMGVDVGGVTRLEAGKLNPTIATLTKVSNALQVDVPELLTEAPTPKR